MSRTIPPSGVAVLRMVSRRRDMVFSDFSKLPEDRASFHKVAEIFGKPKSRPENSPAVARSGTMAEGGQRFAVFPLVTSAVPFVSPGSVQAAHDGNDLADHLRVHVVSQAQQASRTGP